MTKWIVLLRGINVGGHRKLPMAEFRRMLANMGFQEPKTYIQSGNAVFSSDDTEKEITVRIADGIEKSFGFKPNVMVVKATELSTAISENPFPQAIESPNLLHLNFFNDPPNTIDATALQSFATMNEEFSFKNNVFYLYTPNGFSSSKLAAKLTSIIKEPLTARNLRSCMKISELAGKP